MHSPSLSARRPLAAAALGIATLLGACADAPLAPEASQPAARTPLAPSSAIVVGGLTIYTDRAAWQAAVAASGSTAQLYDFAGLTLGRVTQLDTDYGAFGILVDHVSASTFSNPGIDIFPDANCSLGSGDCEVFTFNMKSASSGLDMPTQNQLVMPQAILAFGGDFIQVGYTAPTVNRSGPVTLQFGATSVVVDSYLDASGDGFFGFVASSPATTLTFTYAQAAFLQNDIFQVYNPAFAFPGTTAPDPAQEIEDLESLIDGMSIPTGIELSLDSKLAVALAALRINDTATACAALQDLINHVNAQAGKKKISTANAAAIVTETRAIRTLLGC